MTFSEYIRLCRLEAGFTQQLVCDKLKLNNRGDIHKREAGKVEWKWKEIVLLSLLFDFSSVSEFIKEWETK